MCKVSIVCVSSVQLEASELLQQSRRLGHSRPGLCQFRRLRHRGCGGLICLAVIDSQGFQLEQRSPLKREMEASPSWHISAGSAPHRPLGMECVVFFFFLPPPVEKYSLSSCYNSHYLIVLDFPEQSVALIKQLIAM